MINNHLTCNTGHNIQIVAEGKCGDVGTIFRDAVGGAAGGPPQGGANATGANASGSAGQDPTQGTETEGNELAASGNALANEIPRGNLAGDLEKRQNGLDILGDNRRIMGDGVAGETLEHFGTCWDGKVTNPSNPARRDVAQLQSNHYIVLQWDQDNPGVWVSFAPESKT